MSNIFITGATGLLGWNLAKELLRDEDMMLYLLVRENEKGSAKQRIFNLIKRDCDKNTKTGMVNRVKVIEGDITCQNLGIDKHELKELSCKIDKIYHCAALCEFAVPLEKIRKINVYGVKNVLDFASKCNLKSFNHVSTVGVAGKSGGTFYEDSLDIGQAFNNTYEQSKFEAEKLLKNYSNDFPIVIFRPAIIVGHSFTGEVNEFQMFYQLLHFLSLELLDEIPINKSMVYNITPVDYVAKAIAIISSNSKNTGKTYQLANPISTSFNFFLDTAVSYFGFKKPKVVSEEKHNYNKLSGFCKKILDIYMPYLTHKKIIYDTTNFDLAMDGVAFKWPIIEKKLLTKIFRFCNDKNYIKKRKR